MVFSYGFLASGSNGSREGSLDPAWLDEVGAKGNQSYGGLIMGQYVIIVVELVGGLEHQFYDFPYIGNKKPNWQTHMFQRGRYTTNQIMYYDG